MSLKEGLGWNFWHEYIGTVSYMDQISFVNDKVNIVHSELDLICFEIFTFSIYFQNIPF